MPKTGKNDKVAEVKTEAVKETVAPAAPKVEEKPAAPKATETVAAPKAAEKKSAAKTTAKPAAEKKPAKKTAAKKTADAAPAAKKGGRKSAAKTLTVDTVIAAAKKKFANAKTAKIKYPIAANVELRGACSGIFYVYIGEAGVAVEPYKYEDYDIYFRADAEDFNKVLEDKANIYDALADGLVSLDGNTKKAVLFVNAAF